MSKQQALDLLDEFEARSAFKAFKRLDRGTVASDLRARVNNPFLISQGTKAGVCGPSAVAFELLKARPFTYVLAATRLFELGFAIINKWEIKPDNDLLTAPCPATVAQGDWVVLASIRDSENWFWDFHEDVSDDSANTTLREIEDWMKKAGYTDIKREEGLTNIFDKTKMFNNALSLYSNDNYQVILRINASCIDSEIPSAPIAGNHVVVLVGDYKPPASKSDTVSIPIYTWGQRLNIPRKGGLTYGQFLDQFFGYVAAKW